MLDITVIVFYFLLTLSVGIYKGRATKSVKDFTTSKGQFDTTALVATIFGTIIGGGSTMEPLTKIFVFGLFLLIPYFGECMSKLIMSELIAPRFNKFQNLISAGDIMETGYGKWGKIITGLSGFLLLSGYVGAQLSACSIFIGYFTGIPVDICVFVSAFVVVTYSAFGGIRAVTATDVIQFTVIIVAFPVIAHLALYEVGGWSMLLKALPAEKISLFPKDKNTYFQALNVFIFCLPYMSPAVIQRLLMAKDCKQIAKSFRIAAIIDIPFYITLAVVALSVLALEPNIDSTVVMPYMIDNHLPSLFKGLAIAGILAIIMSSADSFLNSASVSLIHDFIGPLFGRRIQDKHELLLIRASTVLIGLLAVFAALYFKSILAIHFGFAKAWVPVVLVPLIALIFGNVKEFKVFILAGCAGLLAAMLSYLVIPNINCLIPGVIFNACVFFLWPSKKSQEISNLNNSTVVINESARF